MWKRRERGEGEEGVREGESERGRESLILPNELLLTPNYLPCPIPNPQFYTLKKSVLNTFNPS